MNIQDYSKYVSQNTELKEKKDEVYGHTTLNTSDLV